MPRNAYPVRRGLLCLSLLGTCTLALTAQHAPASKPPAPAARSVDSTSAAKQEPAPEHKIAPINWTTSQTNGQKVPAIAAKEASLPGPTPRELTTSAFGGPAQVNKIPSTNQSRRSSRAQEKGEGGIAGAPTNDTCATAQLITCGQTITADNIGATDDGLQPSCTFAGAPTNSDVWYRFVATEVSGTVSLCASTVLDDTVLSVYNGCGGAEIACLDDGCGPIGLNSEVLLSGLTVGNTYYIRVAGWDQTPQGEFVLSVNCFGACVTCSPNEGEPLCGPEYVDATNGGCNSTPPVFTTIACGQTVCGESGTYTVGGGAFEYRDTDWWLVTLTSPHVLTWTVTAEFPHLIGFVRQPCPQGAFLGDPVLGGPCATSSVVSACLPAGQYVCFVAPSVFSGVTCGAKYSGSLTCEPCTPPPAPVNDNCVDATLLTCGQTITDDNIGATDDGLQPSCTFAGAPTNSDVWYKFVATEVSANVSLCASTVLDDTVLSVYNGCGGAEIACLDDGCGVIGLNSEVLLSGLTVGNTYYIRVAGWDQTPQGEFVLSVNCFGACVTCSPNEGEPLCGPEYVDATNGGCNSTPPVFTTIACGQTVCGESGTYLFQGAQYRDTDWWLVTLATPQILTWTVTAEFPHLIGFVGQPCPQGAFLGDPVLGSACATSSVVSACLPAGQYVCFVAPSVFSGVTCGAKYSGSLTCEPCTPPPAPVNDNCSGAITLECGVPLDDDNIGATNDGLLPACTFAGAPTNSDVWYKFVATDPTATVGTCATTGSLDDSVVSVYSACGGAEIGCLDDGCGPIGLNSDVSLTGLTVGATYYVRVAGWNVEPQGNFTITLTTVCVSCAGDTDNDNDVDADDLTNVILQWGSTCPCNADVDNDNDVDADDLTIVILNWGSC